MPTSGSIDFSVTRDDIIQEAYEQLGVLNEGETPTDDQITSASRTLNMMMKSWQADQMNLFAIDRYVVFVEKETKQYTLNSSTTANFTRKSNIQKLTIATETLEGSNTLELEDASGLVSGDFIGINTGTDTQWTTVAGTPVGNTVTLSDTLDNDTVVGGVVWSYRTKANRPMKIMEAYIHITKSESDIPVGKLSRRKYDELSIKGAQGLINQFYYDPQLNQGNLYVWPTGSDESNYLELVVQRTLEDLDGADDEPDFPQEWFLPLSLGLAVLIGPKVGVEIDVYQEIKSEAQRWYDICKGWDEELYTSVFFRPDPSGYDR